MSLKKSLADITSALSKTGSDNAEWKKFFAFYKAEVGTTTTWRFFPDADVDNPLGFLVENLTHEFRVNGKRERYACLRMYGEACPTCDRAARYFDKNSLDHDEDLGRVFYRKRSFIGQGMVVSASFADQNTDVPRLIEFGPKIFKAIQTAFQSGDMDDPPYEFKGGHNFRIVKSKSGEYPDYGSSTFSPRPSDVDLAIVESIKLYDLREHRTPRTTPELLELAMSTVLRHGSPSAAVPLPTVAVPESSVASSPMLDRLRARQAEEQRKRLEANLQEE